MSWHDPDTPMPSVGYGEFELDVHSNDCYAAGSPDSLVGQQTMSDARGRTVSNPPTSSTCASTRTHRPRPRA